MAEKGPIYGVELLDALPLDGTGGMQQALPSRDDLVKVRRVSDRTVAGYEVLLEHYRRALATIAELQNLGPYKLAEEIRDILADVPTLHQRKCYACGKTHWHADIVAPYVLCQGCGSQDTRRIKSASR